MRSVEKTIEAAGERLLVALTRDGEKACSLLEGRMDS